ncbi:MAG: anthranilate phosphoribosyltransferase [Bdellovibrionales bacterium]|nr:anthranilate phosphoribosyltransferase [Oligoflexia bacterium]
MKFFLNAILEGKSLTQAEAYNAAKRLIEAEIAPEQIAGLLVALRMKDETTEELLGFMQAFRETAPVFTDSFPLLMDVCGTGGDHSGTFNVSTGVAIVLASCGVPVAKHGNRGVSSQSGSTDVLETLQIQSDHHPEAVRQALKHLNISFLFAPSFYPVFAKIAPIRKRLGVYTLFNALGPILNPAPITHQLMGVYDAKLLKKMGEVLKAKGLKRAFVVHGADGLDEVSLSGLTEVVSLDQGKLTHFSVSPEEFGLKRASLSEVQGGNAQQNAAILESIFKGVKSPKRDLIVLNAAMGLNLSGHEKHYLQAAQRAEQALDSGATLALLTQLQKRGIL